jgi:hypothetical protein
MSLVDRSCGGGAFLLLAAPIRARVALLDESAGTIRCGRLRATGPGLLVALCRKLVASGCADCAVQVLHREGREPAAFIVSFAACAGRPQ